LNPIQAFYQAELQPVVRRKLSTEVSKISRTGTTFRRGDRSTKLSTASPSCGGLNYSPMIER
jgi:hypothetical protein